MIKLAMAQKEAAEALSAFRAWAQTQGRLTAAERKEKAMALSRLNAARRAVARLK